MLQECIKPPKNETNNETDSVWNNMEQLETGVLAYTDCIFTFSPYNGYFFQKLNLSDHGCTETTITQIVITIYDYLVIFYSTYNGIKP